MRLVRVLLMVVATLVLAASCSSTGSASTSTAAPTVPSVLASSTLAPSSTTTASPTTLPATTLPPATLLPTTVVPSPTCTRVTDFAGPEQQQSWRVTLDGVMGGLSSGDVAFEDSTMVFTGEIVTNGGGFSLLRTPLGFDTFISGSYLVVRGRTDGRGYEMVFKDAVDGARARLFHEAQMPFADTDEWQEIRVELSDLLVTNTGRPVSADPFVKDDATEMGVILKDGVDGPFRLELDWVDVCADPQ